MTARPEAPLPLSRRGPRPLLLHLGLALGRTMTSSSNYAGGLPDWSSVWENGWWRETKPAAVKAAFADLLAQDRALIAGIAAYRRAPYARQMQEPPCLWQEGESRLLDYGGAGPVVLFVPSLINRAYVLDLMEDASMLRWLADNGVHPLLLDWGWPGAVERHFSLTDYVAGRLERALGAVAGPVILAGYCMGGLLALAAALRQPARVSGLALLATPWDFQAPDPAAARQLAACLPALEPMMNVAGSLPIDALQSLFTMIDPTGVAEKFRNFAAMDKASSRAIRFVAMEDWLADGVPLAAPVARECIGQWYGANLPARLGWRVAGLAVDPAALACPSFCAVPLRDRLVPPQSARPLAALLQDPVVIEPAAGHVSMVAGTHAKSALWRPFAAWLHSL